VETTAAVLRRMVELTELEARLIPRADVAGMAQIFDERATLIAALPETLPPGCRALAERFVALATANEHAATEAADVIRRELSKVSTGRGAVTAYAPAAPFVSMDREG
jgi:hypothetical protein